MKKISIITLLFCATFSFAQKVSDFEYVYVPKDFEKKINDYNLNGMFVKALKSKSYKVIQDDALNWPLQLRDNSCKVLNADVVDDSNLLRNRVKIVFKDCKNKVIQEIKGSSMEKDFEAGFTDALNKAVAQVPKSNPSAEALVDLSQQPSDLVPKVQATNSNVTSNDITSDVFNKEKVDSKNMSVVMGVSSDAMIYTNGGELVTRINLNSNQFILAKMTSSTPYATFTQTSKEGVYHVKLADNSAAMGYIENKDIIIEIPKGENFEKLVFKRN